MAEERRQASIETIIMEMGSMKQLASDTKTHVENLVKQVSIQNGRVGKLEQWVSLLKGMGIVIVLIILPIAAKIIPDILIAVFGR